MSSSEIWVGWIRTANTYVWKDLEEIIVRLFNIPKNYFISIKNCIKSVQVCKSVVSILVSHSQTLFFLCVGAGKKTVWWTCYVNAAGLSPDFGDWTALPEWRKLLFFFDSPWYAIIKTNCSLPVLTMRLRSSDNWLCLLYLWAVHSSPLHHPFWDCTPA